MVCQSQLCIYDVDMYDVDVQLVVIAQTCFNVGTSINWVAQSPLSSLLMTCHRTSTMPREGTGKSTLCQFPFS